MDTLKKIRRKVWRHVICYVIGKNRSRLQCNDTRRYDRNLLYALIRDYLVQMTEMDRLVRLHGSVDDSVVEKLLEQYDEQLLIRWNDVRQSKEYAVIIHNVQKFIHRCMKNKDPPSLITTLAWEKQRVYIIETIIEPYMQLSARSSKVRNEGAQAAKLRDASSLKKSSDNSLKRVKDYMTRR